ncbi:unnamed protein product [Notodromas monacha]|uniref:Acyltransferase n=1 Tax=Notodromas monacha TaxID=399045 RepID=A0A7R9BSW8_9CRUS|nr:unnamed protein product [Notodromas monacha]CAG0920059.1 unnamed protein product [Notodromas monacha]
MKVLGFEFAPLEVPFERRKQTAGVAIWMWIFMALTPMTLTILIGLLFTSYWWITLAYATYYFFDRDICNRGGRRSEWVRNWWCWKSMADYFPITLVKTTELSPDENYIFGCHPHGILPAGAFTCFATEACNFSKVFPGIKPTLLSLHGNFLSPGFRDIFLMASAASASGASINHLLGRYGAKGEAICLVIGGAAESLYCRPSDVIKIILKPRKGFIKMALRHGASLVPVFSFGETEVYDQFDNPEGSIVRWVQEKFRKRFGLAPPLFHGRGIFQYTFGLLPHRKPISVVVGGPIKVVKKEDFTRQDVDEIHADYTKALAELFEAHKEKYFPNRNLKLEIL